MRLILLIITTFLSIISTAQLERINSIPLPNGLSKKSNAFEIYTTPNPDYGEIVRDRSNYGVKWSHQTFIVAHQTIKIKELGAYLLYNGSWMLRQTFNKKDVKQMFQTNSLELEKGDTIVYEDNVRFDNYSSTGWNFWYAKVIGKDGKEYSALDYLETKGVSEAGKVLIPLSKDSSSLKWLGKAGDSDYELSGSITSIAGGLIVLKDSVIGGNLQIDMTSISHENEQLINHLKSSDFFDVVSNPLATFLIKEIQYLSKNSFEVIGVMNLLGNAKQETTTAIMEEKDGHYYLTIDMVLDRTKYGMTYASSQDDNSDYSISDNIYLTAKLVFRKDYPSSLPWNKMEKP